MKTLSFLILFIFITNSSDASHIFGADLTYTCQGNGNYLITYTFYRNCFGIPAQTSHLLTVTNYCTGMVSNYTMPVIPPGVLISDCRNSTSCNGGTLIGVEKYIYQTVISLPDTCNRIILGVSTSARNNGINTIQNPDSYPHYVEASINNTNNICDTSAVFMNDPVLMVCTDQIHCIDPGLTDAESDSIVASFINPLAGPNTNLPYDSGYSVQFPMALDSPLIINNSNGVFCFTPLTTLGTVYAIKVSSYRNGILIGEVERDVMLYNVPCSASQPEISLTTGMTTDTFVCVNTPICLDLITTDPTPNDSTWLSWDGSIPAANFTIAPGQNESGSFCWTPGVSDISQQPHCFNAYVTDNNCPVFQFNTRKYCIMVYDSATCATLNTPEINTDYHLKIYPQPAGDVIIVELIHQNKKLIFSVTDLSGKIILERKINPFENKFSLPAKEIKPGIYLAILRNEDGTVVSQNKIVKIEN